MGSITFNILYKITMPEQILNHLLSQQELFGSPPLCISWDVSILPKPDTFKLEGAIYHFYQRQADDGGHDVIDNFEFPCNSMENLISI